MIQDIDKANEEFWNELCGTSLAKSIGIKSHSLSDLKQFDDAYLALYPYLLRRVKIENMSGKRVLEVGLGYGTLGQKLVEAGAKYTGMDIAEGPVKVMNHRLQIHNYPGKAIKDSILSSTLENESFDYIVSIGCFHHTGDIQKCIDETFRLLKPGGEAYIMLYNQFSLRQWIKWPFDTLLALLRDYGLIDNISEVHIVKRKAFDVNSKGSAAPETIFLSIKQSKKIFRKFKIVRFFKENCDPLIIKGKLIFSRDVLLPIIGKLLGLDIYVRAQK